MLGRGGGGAPPHALLLLLPKGRLWHHMVGCRGAGCTRVGVLGGGCKGVGVFGGGGREGAPLLLLLAMGVADASSPLRSFCRCHGTGVMTVGDQLFCAGEGCQPCPVCRGSVSVCRERGQRRRPRRRVPCSSRRPCGWLCCAGLLQVPALPRHRQARIVDQAGVLHTLKPASACSFTNVPMNDTPHLYILLHLSTAPRVAAKHSNVN